MTSSKIICLITGGNQGIGWEAAKALLISFPQVHVILGSRSVERGQKAIESLMGKGIKGSVSMVQLDVTDDSSIQNAAKQVEQEFGHLDTLVNNAGIVSLTGTLREQCKTTLDTNATGAAVVTDLFAPLLKQSQSPRIVHVTSELGSITQKLDPEFPYSKMPAISYRMSKAAMNMLGACHQVEYGEWGAKVFIWNPGFTVTNLTGEADRERRVNMGAHAADIPAKGLAEIVTGRRDREAGTFLDVTSGTIPW